MYGLKGGVALGYRKDYFDAYRFGVKGVKLLDEVYKNNPQFEDIELSKGILKLMIAQSTWYVRWLAPLIVESGSISEGIGHLDKVVQDGEYVSDEALLAFVLLLWGDVDKDYLSKSLSALEKFTEHYPDNIQIYRIEKYIRFMSPFSALILTFIGVIVSSRKTRGGVGFQIAIGFLIAFIFIILFIASKSMAETGSINPLLAVWMPNIVFSGVAMLMYKIVPK